MKYRSAFVTITLSVVLIFFSNLNTKAVSSSTALPLSDSIFFLMRSVAGMLLAPLFYIKFFLKRPVKDFGFALPENKKDFFILTVIVVFLTLPLIAFFSGSGDFTKTYKYSDVSVFSLFFQTVFLSAIYYTSEEFIFRGFMLFSLFEFFGFWGVLYTNVIFAFFHIGKPFLEIIFSFFSGLTFSYLSIKTKSFLPAAIAHYFIALLLNLMINFVP